MILRLRYLRGTRPVDLEVKIAPEVTAGELAQSLVERDPSRPMLGQDPAESGPYCLVVGSRHSEAAVVDAGATILGSPIVSGVDIDVAAAGDAGAGLRPVRDSAKLEIVSGPDAGRSFQLRQGTYIIGRGRKADIQIRDTTVSAIHAKVIVGGDSVEIIDNNSANGILMGGVSIARAVVRPSDHIQLGDSTVKVKLISGSASATADPTDDQHFVRSPRISAVFPEVELQAPDIPALPMSEKLSFVMIMTPLLLGAILFATTQSVASLLFVLLTPLLGLAQWLESQVDRWRTVRRNDAQFRDELRVLQRRMHQMQQDEIACRLRESPGASDAASAVAARSDLLWCRRPDEPNYLDVRFGLGTAPSRITVSKPAGNQNESLQQTLRDFTSSVGEVSGVPIVASLRHSALGVAGEGEPARSAARSLLLQVAALHAPQDVTIAACIGSQSADLWDWLKWLPHAGGTTSPITGPTIAAGPGPAARLVGALEELLATRPCDDRFLADKGPAIVVFVENDSQVDRARLVAIAENGPEHGIHVIWLAPSRRALPAACRAYLEVPASDRGTAGFVSEAYKTTPVTVDQIRLEDTVRLARLLSPVVDSGSLLRDDSDLPGAVSFLELADPELGRNPDAIAERWRESDSLSKYRVAGARRKPGTLRALLGQSSSGPLILDLRADGPHALVGGTTGSGKSELLQTWILSLAANHSPERVNFLFVDYKGGSAFGECVELPHSVGLVTDLNPHLVGRALASLDAEVRRRERLLRRARAKDLIEMEKSASTETPPSLVIVVDEFAALIHEIPEFVDGVVNVAQRGRSLGLHLILATQRPAGVIKDNLRANTNLRLALRMADEEDSIDVLGTPLAASFDPSAPGRAALRRGPGRSITFQAAYVGGVTQNFGPRHQIVISQLSATDPAPWPEPQTADDAAPARPTDLKQILTTIQKAAQVQQIEPPRKPWLPELPAVLDMAQLPSGHDDRNLVFALRDEPGNQAQIPCGFHPEVDGNLAVYGASGSGKSASLRSLAIAAGLSRTGPVHVYGLDFGARGLQMLEPLPHVGSIVTGDDTERVGRLLRMLRDTVKSRSQRFALRNCTSLTDYRREAQAPQEPRILLLLDGLAAFRQAHDMGSLSGFYELLISVAADGRQVGVHVVVTADRTATVPSSLSSLISNRLALRLADENDMSSLGVPRDMFSLTSPPGRGYLDGHEVQVAVLGGSSSGVDQARAIAKFARSMAKHTDWPTPDPVMSLSTNVRYDELPIAIREEPVIGVSGEDLAPATVIPEGTFVISGPPCSGRTTTLQTVVRAVCTARPGTKTAVFTPQRVPAVARSWDMIACGSDEAATKADELRARLSGAGPAGPGWVIVVESPAEFLHSSADDPLCLLVGEARRLGHLIVAEGDTQSMSGSWQLQQVVKFSRRGIVMQPDQEDGDAVLKTSFPRVRRSDFPKGRGLLVRDGRATVVQVAWAGVPGD